MTLSVVKSRARRWAARFFSCAIWATASFCLLTVGAKVTYSSIVEYRCSKWEASLRRDAFGRTDGFQSYTVGDGRTAILLIHGFGSSPAIFSRMASALAERGYTCRAMCLPGYGMASKEFAKANREQWVDAIRREVVALRRTADRVWILGHSMGASLAVDYALEFPGTADGVVLLTPLIAVSNARSPLLPPRTVYEISRHVFGPRDLVESVFPEDFRTNEPVSQPARVVFTPFAVYEQAFAVMDQIGRRAPELTVPVLMVLARHDKVVDSAAAERYFGQVGSTKKELMVLDDAAHVVPLDNGWQAVVAEVDAFIGPAEPALAQAEPAR
jgi:carboxylesterase